MASVSVCNTVASKCHNAVAAATMLETAAGHQPISDQFQHMANQKSIRAGQTCCKFSMGGQ